MAVPAELGPEKSLQPELPVLPEHRAAALHAVQLYGLGYSRRQVAKALHGLMYEKKPLRSEDRQAKILRRLHSWEKRQWFRDLVWDSAVVELDMTTPAILRGVANRAKRGRIDAAKLALGITGRYVEKQEQTPAAVTINLVGIPRPRQQLVEAQDEAIQLGEVIDED